MNQTTGSLTIAVLLLAGGCGGGSGGETAVRDDVPDVTGAVAPGSNAVDTAGSPSEAPSAGGPAPADAASPFGVETTGDVELAGNEPDDDTPGADDPGEDGDGGLSEAVDDISDGTVPAASVDDGSTPPPSMGDDGPDRQAPVGDGDDTDALIGLWDYTRVTDAGTDVALFAIGSGGVVTEYDYRADAVGDGRDCHVTATAAIASRGSDRYDIQNSSFLPGSDSMDDVLITAAGGEITFRYLGEVFDLEFGSGQAGITETYRAVTDRRADDLPLCKG